MSLKKKKMNNNEYSRLVESTSNIPVFYQPWYLDAVSGKNLWDVCIAFLDPQRWGVLPYSLVNIEGINAVCIPPITQYMGPYVHIDSGMSCSKHYSAEDRILKKLLTQVQQCGDYYAQKWGPWQDNWLPAYHCGFSQSSRMTYIIYEDGDYEVAMRKYSTQVRNKLKNKNKIVIREECDPDLLYSMACDSLKKIDKAPKYTSVQLSRLIEGCVAHSSGRQLVAFSQEGHPLASVLLLEDEMCLYYYIAGEFAEYRGMNAPTLLVDECVKIACNRKKMLDFTGSMIPSVSRFYQSFGPQIVNYHMISKDNRENHNSVSSRSIDRKLLFRF